jgi:hypothetical protein
MFAHSNNFSLQHIWQTITALLHIFFVYHQNKFMKKLPKKLKLSKKTVQVLQQNNAEALQGGITYNCTGSTCSRAGCPPTVSLVKVCDYTE